MKKTNRKNKFYAKLKVNNKIVEFQMDTGASVNVMSIDTV